MQFFTLGNSGCTIIFIPVHALKAGCLYCNRIFVIRPGKYEG